ncbi:MAG TPA: choice-of-anchor Q domain-containing protein [Edaphobacter sp.]|nr:choice-of-anchor Q domain-containing protein [Edaphobacter sp.]
MTACNRTPSHPTEYYVGPNGSDSAIGSDASPFATIHHASTVVKSGDTVIVLDGTYTGDILTTTSGTFGHPITYMAQHPWQAKLVGTRTGDNTKVWAQDGDYITVQGFDITGPDYNGIAMEGIYGQGIGNRVHDIHPACDANGGSGISANGAATGGEQIGHNDIIGNVVFNITHLATDTGCGVTHNDNTDAIYPQTPFGNTANNIVLNSRQGIASWHAARNEVIVGNTIINCDFGILVGSGDSHATTNDNTIAQNNIIVGASVYGIVEEGTTGPNNRYVDNLLWNITGTPVQLQTGKISGTITADPKFVNYTGNQTGDYHLSPTSPAIGSGLAFPGLMTDYAGIARPQSGPMDIGALLHSGTQRPLQ